jgi:hypothetical protein
MNKLVSSIIACVAFFLAAILSLSSPAQAQLRHTWIASYGNDGNACDRLTPCATLGGAFARTIAGGEITCVDSGNFVDGTTITKSITINCEGAIFSSVAGTSPWALDIVTAASDVVVFKGLDFDGAASVGEATLGLINFTGAGTLIVDKVKVANIHGAASGIRFAPNGPAKLAVSNSIIAGNGSSVSAAGILINPQPGGSANVTVSRTELHGNYNGIYLNGAGGGGAVNLSVRDSDISNSSNCGIVLATNGPALTAMIDRTTVNSSYNAGVAVSGAAATVSLGNSTISGNVTGVLAINGGNLRSFKNNQIKFNLTNNTPIVAVDGLD